MNTKITIILLFIFTVLAFSCEHKSDITTSKEVCFDTEILPIFQNNCATCHGNERTEKDLKYIDYSSIMKSIKAGDATGSKAYKAIISVAGENAMPPDAPLSLNQRTLIRLWIEQGAKETKCSTLK